MNANTRIARLHLGPSLPWPSVRSFSTRTLSQTSRFSPCHCQCVLPAFLSFKYLYWRALFTTPTSSARPCFRLILYFESPPDHLARTPPKYPDPSKRDDLFLSSARCTTA